MSLFVSRHFYGHAAVVLCQTVSLDKPLSLFVPSSIIGQAVMLSLFESSSIIGQAVATLCVEQYHWTSKRCHSLCGAVLLNKQCLLFVSSCILQRAVKSLFASSNSIGQAVVTLCVEQYHWTNKHHVDHWYDSSGLTLYYTPHLRPNDAGVMVIGQDFLEIPPGVNSITMSGSCSSECTQRFMHADINVMAVLNHMHYLGK